ncbi:hypothetical protein AO366_1627 [Moraxella catarrhalis]|uniref:Uncharacterized protein n=1 Tax=Moraxella catarrhalis TaxID=480 RepID=A0AB36DNW5_MORCA|nr:hypothetical protein [Moraxella catarrhalis]OAV13152.1 hypothetical protein AO376_1740 [Moraxella catarrhalis]OAV19597.1 hypothetical protein AO374_0655 [Moraxella catarrhalis]OAV25315.1 hypothetical protein AO370_1065 [Moraxella catarrhalis]OAV27666.1 hypothetical protein AO368_1650 [Moraxella catarrhalis]OAV32067.1 hypothetical protein AO366_1627 [Moraxella catarrhalis]
MAGITVSASTGKGNAQGESVHYTNSLLEALDHQELKNSLNQIP